MPRKKAPAAQKVAAARPLPKAQELPTNVELKSIVAQIEALTELTEAKISYSYKALSRQMSLVVEVVAELNIAITDALLDDDLIDERDRGRAKEVDVPPAVSLFCRK